MRLKDRLRKIEKSLKKDTEDLLIVITDDKKIVNAQYKGKDYKDQKDIIRLLGSNEVDKIDKKDLKTIIIISKEFLPQDD